MHRKLIRDNGLSYTFTTYNSLNTISIACQNNNFKKY